MAGREHRVTPSRFHPWIALRSAWRATRDPDDTAAGIRLVLCFEGLAAEENYDRFLAHPLGARIQAGAATAYDLLRDREALRELPAASLGRAYLAFVETEQISTEGLAAAAVPVEEALLCPTPATRRYLDHTRSMHDLWHVVTGYSRDVFGEILLLAFSYGQLRTRSFRWIVRFAGLGVERKLPGTPVRRLLAEAQARGERATWLTTADWQALLPLPLDDVRERLGVGPPPTYPRYYPPPTKRTVSAHATSHDPPRSEAAGSGFPAE